MPRQKYFTVPKILAPNLNSNFDTITSSSEASAPASSTARPFCAAGRSRAVRTARRSLQINANTFRPMLFVQRHCSPQICRACSPTQTCSAVGSFQAYILLSAVLIGCSAVCSPQQMFCMQSAVLDCPQTALQPAVSDCFQLGLQ